ncbi:uncharacterized protein BDZ99DRAFT_502270 [Mytilinidion resinicola]|uniref:Uncharacterized protein n=1 Tax=Mytilinidion resinicola TaxID=574789 RepID=A0A6A6Y9Z3_9PEZI|nr:uncharacterized protein BDZ99DRAFT_502270 [Mytilinidion resinicola]KAF2804814.1 hypothetical protein BDZ99DRAFT_502270 [Mytilinidion resinicola]
MADSPHTHEEPIEEQDDGSFDYLFEDGPDDEGVPSNPEGLNDNQEGPSDASNDVSNGANICKDPHLSPTNNQEHHPEATVNTPRIRRSPTQSEDDELDRQRRESPGLNDTYEPVSDEAIAVTDPSEPQAETEEPVALPHGAEEENRAISGPESGLGYTEVDPESPTSIYSQESDGDISPPIENRPSSGRESRRRNYEEDPESPMSIYSQESDGTVTPPAETGESSPIMADPESPASPKNEEHEGPTSQEAQEDERDIGPSTKRSKSTPQTEEEPVLDANAVFLKSLDEKRRQSLARQSARSKPTWAMDLGEEDIDTYDPLLHLFRHRGLSDSGPLSTEIIPLPKEKRRSNPYRGVSVRFRPSFGSGRMNSPLSQVFTKEQKEEYVEIDQNLFQGFDGIFAGDDESTALVPYTGQQPSVGDDGEDTVQSAPSSPSEGPSYTPLTEFEGSQEDHEQEDQDNRERRFKKYERHAEEYRLRYRSKSKRHIEASKKEKEGQAAINAIYRTKSLSELRDERDKSTVAGLLNGMHLHDIHGRSAWQQAYIEIMGQELLRPGQGDKFREALTRFTEANEHNAIMYAAFRGRVLAEKNKVLDEKDKVGRLVTALAGMEEDLKKKKDELATAKDELSIAKGQLWTAKLREEDLEPKAEDYEAAAEKVKTLEAELEAKVVENALEKASNKALAEDTVRLNVELCKAKRELEDSKKVVVENQTLAIECTKQLQSLTDELEEKEKEIALAKKGTGLGDCEKKVRDLLKEIDELKEQLAEDKCELEVTEIIKTEASEREDVIKLLEDFNKDLVDKIEAAAVVENVENEFTLENWRKVEERYRHFGAREARTNDQLMGMTKSSKEMRIRVAAFAEAFQRANSAVVKRNQGIEDLKATNEDLREKIARYEKKIDGLEKFTSEGKAELVKVYAELKERTHSQEETAILNEQLTATCEARRVDLEARQRECDQYKDWAEVFNNRSKTDNESFDKLKKEKRALEKELVKCKNDYDGVDMSSLMLQIKELEADNQNLLKDRNDRSDERDGLLRVRDLEEQYGLKHKPFVIYHPHRTRTNITPSYKSKEETEKREKRRQERLKELQEERRQGEEAKFRRQWREARELYLIRKNGREPIQLVDTTPQMRTGTGLTPISFALMEGCQHDN